MIRTSKRLKDLVRNMSKIKNTDPLILMRNYMIERFIERIAHSDYKDRFILKGGMLIAAMVGVETRSTMDIDATMKSTRISVASVDKIVAEINSIPMDDGVTYSIKSVTEIMDDADYGGIRVSMDALFDGARIPLKVDISTGDVITPQALIYDLPLMFEERTVPILAYPLETVLAEKLETIIVRSVTNTRMRDLYDIYILQKIYSDRIQPNILYDALVATSQKRGSFRFLQNAENVFTEVELSIFQQKLWQSYQQKFHYALHLSWADVMNAVCSLERICRTPHQNRLLR